MIRTRTALALFVCTIAAPAFALTYTFRNVADSDGPFSSFGGAPVINEGGDVAFVASLDSGVQGIYSGPDPGTDTIADDGGPYDSPLDVPSINRDGTVVFRAFLDPTPENLFGGIGLFTGDDPDMDTVADSWGDFFGDFDAPSIADDDTVAFSAITVFVTVFGIFKTGVTDPETVADSSGPYANPLLAADINNDGTVVFFANLDAGGSGIFSGENPATDTVADTSGPYSQFDIGPAINDAGTVIFEARLDAGGSGIFRGENPLTDTVVDDKGPYATFLAYSINKAGTVLFSAYLDNGVLGIFTGPNPVADKVIAVGDPLFGSTAASVSLFTENLNDNGEVSFSYVLANGVRGVAVASPASLARAIGAGESYEGVHLASAAGGETVATLREGTAAEERAVALSFSSGSGTEIDGKKPVGDVLDLTGTGTDTYVLELAYGDADLEAADAARENELVLVWLDPGSGSWKDAVLGNAPPGGPRFPGLGFDAYRAGVSDPQLGAHGNDPDANTVWAVLNHAGRFALVAAPEPSSEFASATVAMALLCEVERRRARPRPS